MKRIFYFNITYSCNSNCIFCYSHNTRHNGISYNDMPLRSIKAYLLDNSLSDADKVIINGGEPLLHSDLYQILEWLKSFECEVVIFSNGRLLRHYDFSNLNANFRFVIPLHGTEHVHDMITGIKGSFQETVTGFEHMSKYSCLMDLKIILNQNMIATEKIFNNFMALVSEMKFNHALHVTNMADTIVSRRNQYLSLDNDNAAYYTNMLFNHFSKDERIIKLFDTCIKKISGLTNTPVDKYRNCIVVYFKDVNEFRIIDLHKPDDQCREKCLVKKYCISSVNEYKVLEYRQQKFYKELE